MIGCMIGYLAGIIREKGGSFIILDVGGVGYKVFVTPDVLLGEKLGNQTVLYIHTAVRENALDLFGCKTRNELELFELLITISGIGPKSALAILSSANADTLKKAVSSGDTSYLTKISGIGKKTAEKIVIELRDKLGGLGDGLTSHPELKDESEALMALESLGYTHKDARDALKKVQDAQGTEGKIRAALKLLS